MWQIAERGRINPCPDWIMSNDMVFRWLRHTCRNGHGLQDTQKQPSRRISAVTTPDTTMQQLPGSALRSPCLDSWIISKRVFGPVATFLRPVHGVEIRRHGCCSVLQCAKSPAHSSRFMQNRAGLCVQHALVVHNWPKTQKVARIRSFCNRALADIQSAAIYAAMSVGWASCTMLYHSTGNCCAVEKTTDNNTHPPEDV